MSDHRMSCYVAGKMRGVKDFNFPLFHEATAYLRAHGWDVRSPAEHDEECGFDPTLNTLDGFDVDSAIAWDLEQVRQTDAIVILPGWESSKGVAVEKALAEFLDKQILYYNPIMTEYRLSSTPIGGCICSPATKCAYHQGQDSLAEMDAPVWGSTTGEVRSVSSTGGEKGTKLGRYDLIPARPLRLLAEHFGRGAFKYQDNNWRRGYEWSKTFAALQRHAWAAWGGEDLDPETGSPHMVAVAWHALAWVEFMETHPEFDDRPKWGNGDF